MGFPPRALSDVRFLSSPRRQGWKSLSRKSGEVTSSRPRPAYSSVTLLAYSVRPSSSEHVNGLRYGVRDATQFRFRFPNLVKGLSQSFLRALTLNCDQCDVPCALNQREIRVRWNSRLGTVKSESAEYLIILRQDWLGPRSSYPIPNGKVAILIRPVWLRCDVG